MATADEFAALVLEQTQERLRADYPASPQWEWERVSVKPGPKYTKVDIGPEGNMSGKYMIENATGRIFGIKGYGVVHKGHQYGSLDTVSDWYWGGYTGVPAAEAQLRWDKDRNGTLRLRTFRRHSDGLHTVFTITPALGSDDEWDVRNTGEIVAGPLRFSQAKRRAEKLYADTQPANPGQPTDPELFRRTAPQWNCVDYPGDGPHYTPGAGGCAWCGMTQKQIAAEYDRREAERAHSHNGTCTSCGCEKGQS